MKFAKVAFLLVPLLGFGLVLIHVMTQSVMSANEDAAARIARWILCGLSALLGFFVLVVHWFSPSHPKFVLLTRRFVCLKLHVVFGSIEFLAGLAAIACRNHLCAQIMCAQVMVGAALFVHIPTAIYQTPIVFGSRALMIPAYLLCVLLHGYCALQLWQDPGSQFWLIETFLAFSIYAWVRMFYFAFRRLRLFNGWVYSIAVLAAGVIIAPAVLGPSAILFLVAFIVLFVVLHRLILQPSRDELLEFMVEHRRDTYLSGKLRRQLDRVKLAATVPNRDECLSDRAASDVAFDALDTDKNEIVTADELKNFLNKAVIPEWIIDGLISSLREKEISREYFYEHVWTFGIARRIGTDELQKTSNPKERARIVFDVLDLNDNNVISLFEFGLLLMEWDLPPRDVERCMQKYGDDNGVISFDQFFNRLKPIWEFAYRDVIARPLHREQRS